MKGWWFKSGDWNAICDVCGFKYKASLLKKRWDGLMVCEQDWEMRHPQDLIHPIKDMQKLPWTRPRGADILVTTRDSAGNPYCSIISINGVAGRGVAGCAIAGYKNSDLAVLTFPGTFNSNTL